MKAWLPLIVFAAIAAFFAFGLTKDPAKLPSALIDKPFPQFSLSSLDDENAVITKDALIGEVTVVNVFGSWCAACVIEHPNLMEITKEVRLWGVNWRDERESGQSWITKHGDSYDTILFDPDSRLAIDLGIGGAPESYVVDKFGRVRYKHIGIITPEIWNDTLRPIVQSLEAAP